MFFSFNCFWIKKISFVLFAQLGHKKSVKNCYFQSNLEEFSSTLQPAFLSKFLNWSPKLFSMSFKCYFSLSEKMCQFTDKACVGKVYLIFSLSSSSWKQKTFLDRKISAFFWRLPLTILKKIQIWLEMASVKLEQNVGVNCFSIVWGVQRGQSWKLSESAINCVRDDLAPYPPPNNYVVVRVCPE